MALTSSEIAKIGSRAPDFNLPATDGQNYSLKSLTSAKALVVVFSCNHCPYAKAAWPHLTKLAQSYEGQSVAFVAINPNDEIQYPKDSFEVMKQKVKEWQINFPYLRDETQEVARSYGAVCTPDIYVYDQNRRLYYHGRINNNWPPVEKTAAGWQSKEVSENTKEELKEAIDLLLNDKLPPKGQFPSMGCSIKWKRNY